VHGGDSARRAGHLCGDDSRRALASLESIAQGAIVAPAVHDTSVPSPSPARGVPARVVLAGERVSLVPLDPDRHAERLFAASQGDPLLWAYLPYGPFDSLAAFREHLARQAASDDPLFFAVGEAGVASFMRMDPPNGVIEIGNIWFGAPLQRTPAATEAIQLMARYAFDDLGNRRLEWKCNAENARSRAAALRFGFTFEGVFRQHMIVKGRNRDTAWFSLLDSEWPDVRRRFQTWLDPANFDADGRQRTPLAR
jgi:RimJ/RimL family protein N-acetyltransferase